MRGGTLLELGGASFRVETLFKRQGSASSAGDKIIPGILVEVAELRDTARALYSAFKDDPGFRDLLDAELLQLWDGVETLIQTIFVDDVTEWSAMMDARSRISRRDAVVAQFDAVVAALSSISAFQEATSNGVFRDADKSENGAASLFDARASRSNAFLRAVGGTRYGALSTETREQGVAEASLALEVAGVFAYSVIPDTEETADIDIFGDAVYRGGTVAMDGSGNLYRGNIELEVRFGNGSVHGLITGLTNNRGTPWKHRREEVKGIRLPDATLQRDADWRVTGSSSNSALIVYEESFENWFAVSHSRFEGHLLGTGWEAGHQAAGAWSVGRQADNTGYLAGAFGALLGQSTPAPGSGGPETPGDTTAIRTAIVPPGAEIEDGILTLRGTLYGPNSETTRSESDWDDEIRVLSDGRRIEELYELSLDEAIARQGAVHAYQGRNLIALAVEEIVRLRDGLSAITSLGESAAALQERSRLWNEINERVRARVFGTADQALGGKDFANDASVAATDPRKWSTGYPVRRDGRPDDASALDAIDDVVRALATPADLAAAVAPDGGGAFTRTNGASFRPLASDRIAEVWDRSEGRILLWFESTDHTRFGAWRKQTAPNAWSEYRDRTEDDENGPGAFAYSPLPPSSYNDYRFPVGGVSTYSGWTIAVQGRTFYSGTIRLAAHWHEPQRGQYDSGVLSVVINDLATAERDALAYIVQESSGATEEAIKEIHFGGIRVGIDGENRLFFSNSLPEHLGIHFENAMNSPVDLAPEPSVTASFEGKFAGRTAEGPQVAIGTWTLRSGVTHKIGTGATIHGGFGVEIEP